jgi:hypothetical protein
MAQANEKATTQAELIRMRARDDWETKGLVAVLAADAVPKQPTWLYNQRAIGRL